MLKNKLIVVCFNMGILNTFPVDLFSYMLSKETSIEKYLKPIEISESKSGLEWIDCIYVINLDKKTERWKRIFEEQRLKVNRVSDVNGWQLSKEIKEELTGPYPLRMWGGAYGCLLSHLSIIKDAYNRGFNII